MSWETTVVDAVKDQREALGLESFSVIWPASGGGVISWKWRAEDGKLYGDMFRFPVTSSVEAVIERARGALEQAAITQQLVKGQP